MTFKVEVSVSGEDCNAHGWHTNALRFASKAEAEAYGRDLYSRWTAVKEWRAVEEEE